MTDLVMQKIAAPLLTLIITLGFPLFVYANSSWVACTAYSTNYTLGKIVVADGAGGSPEGSATFLAVNGNNIDFNKSNNDELRWLIKGNRPIRFELDGKQAILSLHPGKIKVRDAWARGETTIYEINPTVEYDGAKIQMSGVCINYN